MKRGTAYEQVVAEVLQGMDPGAQVSQGEWVQGPDGRRDMDVLVEGTVEGVVRRTLVECKDYNPQSTGPVGIGIVDALESKRRDLGVDATLICSNAGFTTEAMAKAGRVGIGLISVLKEGDKRVRFAIAEKLYIRQVNVQYLTLTLRNADPALRSAISFDSITFRGASVGDWAIQRLMLVLGANPIVTGSFTAQHNLKEPQVFHVDGEGVIASGVDYNVGLTGNWFEQDTTIDSSGAIYNWLRRRFYLAPGPGRIQYKDVDPKGGRLIELPPDWMLSLSRDLRKGEFSMGMLLVEGLRQPNNAANLSPLVERPDLDPYFRKLDVDFVKSVDA